MDAATGQVIYARDMDARRFPASTTKIMTLILALENSNLDDVVTVSSNAAGTEGSTIWLEAGEKIRMGDLLYGMMMHSGNDATVAVAEHIAGSVDKFAAMMTKKAHEIGAVNTNFANANGLKRKEVAGKIKEAREQGDLSENAEYDAAAARRPLHDGLRYGAHRLLWLVITGAGFEEIVSTKEMHFDWVKNPEHRLRNENQMLWLYRGANGVKTGYTDAAGRCLVSAAKKDGLQLVAVVLDSVYMWNDSIKLLDYGFAHVEPVTLVTEGDVAGYAPTAGGNGTRVPLKAAGTITLAKLKEGDARQYETKLEIPQKLQAPVEEGEVVGRFVVLLDDKEVAATDLLAGTSVTRRSFFLTVWHWLQSLLGVSSAK